MRKKRVLSFLLMLALCINVLSVSVAGSEYEYVHDDIYGYVEDTGICAQGETETPADEPEKSDNTSELSRETDTAPQENSMPETDMEDMTVSEAGISGETEDITESETESASEALAESTTETEETSETETDGAPMPAVILVGEAGAIRVTVEAPEGALPEGVTMAVTEVDAGDYIDSAEETLDEDWTILDAVAVDITFYDADQEEIEPAAAVMVTFENLSLETSGGEGGSASEEESMVFHVEDSGDIEKVGNSEVSMEDGTAVFLAEDFSVYLVASIKTTAYVAQIGTTKYETVAAAISAAGGTETTIQMIGDSTETITIGYYHTITLDLNGHTLDGNAAGSVITVYGTFTLTDSSATAANPAGTGKVTNGSNTYAGGVYNAGTFTLEAGTISGNTASSSGGGVYNAGTFTMNGGAISGNTASSSGGGVYNVGTFTMTGGTISGNTASSGNGGGVLNYRNTFTMTGGTISGNNTASNGGGIYVAASSTFTVSGSPAITGNTTGDETSKETANVYLTSGKYITLGGELTNGASIGVTVSSNTTPTSGMAVRITTETNTSYYSNAVKYIFSDNSDYIVQANSAGYLEISVRSISGSVTISGNAVYGQTISAVVSNAPDGVTYQWMRDGVAITGATGSTYTLTAEDVGKSITVVVSHSSYAGSLTANAGTVAKATLTASISGTTTKVYDGTTDVTDGDLSIMLTGVVSGDTVSASASYTYDSADVGENKTITASNVALSGSAAGNYILADTSVSATAGSITSRALSEDDFSVNTDAETYTGSDITKAITSSLTERTDYTVSYTDNTNAGTATVTLTGIGNYSGKLDYTFTIAAAEQFISYSEDNVTKHINDAAFINALTKTTVDGEITYVSDDSNVATVDENTGEVTMTGAGSATITATAASTGNYHEATASYTLTVTAHSCGEPVFTWSEDGRSCTASFTCADCGDVQTVTAAVTSEIKTAATATENGVTIYTATVTFDGVEYTDTKELADISATGSTESDDSDETESTDTESSTNSETTDAEGETADTNSETTDAEDNSVAATSAETGDDSQMVLWLVLLLVSGVGVSGMVSCHTKRRRGR